MCDLCVCGGGGGGQNPPQTEVLPITYLDSAGSYPLGRLTPPSCVSQQDPAHGRRVGVRVHRPVFFLDFLVGF